MKRKTPAAINSNLGFTFASKMLKLHEEPVQGHRGRLLIISHSDPGLLTLRKISEDYLSAAAASKQRYLCSDFCAAPDGFIWYCGRQSSRAQGWTGSSQNAACKSCLLTCRTRRSWKACRKVCTMLATCWPSPKPDQLPLTLPCAHLPRTQAAGHCNCRYFKCPAMLSYCTLLPV